jgi:hypothetical protein
MSTPGALDSTKIRSVAFEFRSGLGGPRECARPLAPKDGDIAVVTKWMYRPARGRGLLSSVARVVRDHHTSIDLEIK